VPNLDSQNQFERIAINRNFYSWVAGSTSLQRNKKGKTYDYKIKFETHQRRQVMNGLLLHCGGQLKTREEVCAVPAPPATTTYAPLPYESYLVRIEKQLAVEGIKFTEQHLALSNNGQRLFGLLALTLPDFQQTDYGCVLGLRTSYDRSFANGLCIGAAVFVCDNLSFRGEVTFERKHTPGMLRDLSWMISETVATLPMRFAAQSKTFEAYKRKEVGDMQAHDIAIRLWDAGALGALEIPRLIKEWREPQHPEFAQAKSAWRLFNAATEVIKGDLWRLPARTRILHTVLDEICETPPPEKVMTPAPAETVELAA
jgi:hypothetical protein